MNNTQLLQLFDASAYAAHVEECVRCDLIPMQPRTAEQLLVITEEFPHLLSAFLPLMLSDTPTRRAAADLVAESL